MEEILIKLLEKASPNVVAALAVLYFGVLKPLKIGMRANALSGYIRRALVIQRRKVVALEKLEESIVLLITRAFSD